MNLQAEPIEADIEKGTILVVDKPYQWTSFDVVNKLKWKLKKLTGNKKVKIGHAGTLDPLATGVLVICMGKATKLIESLMVDEKEYTGTFFAGATTPSFDLETEIDATYDITMLTDEMIKAVAAGFLGEQLQTPPVFSAKKIDGKRAYEHARSGTEVTMNKHLITIKAFEITRIALPEIDFRVVCSKGTYIRSIASDFGKKLNTGVYLKSLCRTRSGNYLLKDAYSVEEAFDRLIVK